MTAAQHSRLLAGAYLRLWMLTVAAAITVALLPSAAAVAREGLALTLAPHPAALAFMAAISIHNVAAGWPLLLPLLVDQRCARQRALVRAAIAFYALANTVSVGAALGAYPPARLTPYLTHVPLEWAALAVPIAFNHTTITARRAGYYVVAGGLFAALVLCAAVVETYLTPTT